MKKFSLIVFSLFLFACDTLEKEQEVLTKPNVQSEKVETVEVGSFCGGINKIACKSGLRCKLNPESKDNSGVCEDTVLDKNIVCPTDKKPVCGLKDHNKNGYLNECEAKRHGAEVLYEGFCKLDESVKDSCTAKVLGMEGCNKNIQGFEFDGNICVQKMVQGCQAEIPFKTKVACEKKCFDKDIQIAGEKGLGNVCPEEKIVNSMPIVGKSNFPKTYYIYNGKRHEIGEFDAQYLKENCVIKETVVY